MNLIYTLGVGTISELVLAAETRIGRDIGEGGKGGASKSVYEIKSASFVMLPQNKLFTLF